MDFWRIVEVVNARKWIIILTGVLATGLTWGAMRLVGSRWVASVDFIAPATTSLGGPQTQTDDANSDDGHSLALMYSEIIKSQAVIEPVLRSMDRTQSWPEDLVNDIDVSATSPRMYQLQVTDQSSARAAELANALGEQFIKVYHDINTQQAARAEQLLSQQLHVTDSALEEARQRYDTYRSQHNIVANLNGSVDVALTEWRQDLQKRDAALVDLNDAGARLRSLEVLKSQIPALSQTDVIAGSPLAQQQQDLTKADDELTSLRARYTDAMPRVQTAIATRDAIATKLKQEWARDGSAMSNRENASLQSVETEIANLKQSVAGGQAQVAALNTQVASARAELDSYKGVDMPLSMLAGDIAEKSDQRNSLVERLTAARQALDLAERQNPLTMMDRVNEFNPPVNMTEGRTKKLLLLAALASMLCVCALLIALDSVDKRVKTVRQAEQSLPCGILAVIPQPEEAIPTAQMARATEMQPHSVCAEAHRFLGLHLLSTQMSGVHSIMVLAAKAGQGSTSTLCNLAITLAQAGRRVILVDANVRSPEIHSVFDVDNDFGFTDLVLHPTRERLAMALRTTGVKGLQFITSGARPENPWQLFRSEALNEFSGLLHREADYVLYDTASSLKYTDALNLTPIVDAAILCVRAFEPLTGAERRLIGLLELQNVPVLGCVLSDIPAATLETYSNYELPSDVIPPQPAIITEFSHRHNGHNGRGVDYEKPVEILAGAGRKEE